MTRTFVAGGTGRSFTTADLDDTPEIGVIASSPTGIVFMDTITIYRRNGLRSGNWTSHDLSPVQRVGPPGSQTGPIAIVTISAGCYDASTLGARPDRIRLVWSPNTDRIIIYPGFVIPGVGTTSPTTGANYTLQSWTGTTGPIDEYDGVFSVGTVHPSASQTPVTLFLRGEPSAMTVLTGGDHDVLSHTALFEDNAGHGTGQPIPGNSTGRDLRGYTSLTGGVAGSIDDVRYLWVTNDYQGVPFPGVTYTEGVVYLHGANVPVVGIGTADLPAHADIVAAGNSTAPRTLFVAYGTTNGIQLRSLAPGSSELTEHPVLAWPAGYTIANLKGLYLTYFGEGTIGILAVWGTHNTFVLRGHVFDPNGNVYSPDGWLDVATETFAVYTPELWIDRYPFDKTFRLAGHALNATHIWEHHINKPPDRPEITTQHATISVSSSMTIDWVFSDPDFLDSQSQYQVRQIVDGGPPEYWLGTAGSWSSTASAATERAGQAMTATINPAVTGNEIGEVTQVAVRVWDQADAVSPWSNTVRFVRGGVPLDATITSPAPNSTVTSLPITVQWQPRAGQGSYRLIAFTGTGRTRITHLDTGRIYSSASSAIIVVPNGLTQQLGLTLYTTDNVLGATATLSFTTDLPVPGVPSIRAATTYHSALPNILLNYYSASPGTLVLFGVDIYRRLAGDTGDGIRVAADLPIPDNWTTGEDWTDHTPAHLENYEYRPVLKTQYTQRSGSWTRVNNIVETS